MRILRRLSIFDYDHYYRYNAAICLVLTALCLLAGLPILFASAAPMRQVDPAADTPTITLVESATMEPSATASATPTLLPTETATSEATATLVPTETATPETTTTVTATPTPLPTETATPEATATASITPTPLPTETTTPEVLPVVADTPEVLTTLTATPFLAPFNVAVPLDVGLQVLLLIVLSTIVILTLPIGYLLFSRSPRKTRSLLLVSTDEEARKMVIQAAKRVGYVTISVYRYEDALDKLRQDMTVSMIVIDDSVPQYEAGLLVSMLMRLPIGVRPLILIHDSSELGLTAPSYRAEVVVSRPLTEKALEAAIRQVSERTEGAL
jgi:CheY-like chemotaxis protein